MFTLVMVLVRSPPNHGQTAREDELCLLQRYEDDLDLEKLLIPQWVSSLLVIVVVYVDHFSAYLRVPTMSSRTLPPFIPTAPVLERRYDPYRAVSNLSCSSPQSDMAFSILSFDASPAKSASDPSIADLTKTFSLSSKYGLEKGLKEVHKEFGDPLRQRRAHRKSKEGCLGCKRRRVKVCRWDVFSRKCGRIFLCYAFLTTPSH